MKRYIAILLMSLLWSAAAYGQAIWASAEAKYSIDKHWGLSAEGEWRSTDRVSSIERWTVALGGEYKPLKALKLDAGYKYMACHNQGKITNKGNIIAPYWIDRHRVWFSVAGKLKYKRVEFSLRERYQFTQRIGRHVDKTASDGITPKDPEWIRYDFRNILRSRLGCQWNIRHSAFSPYLNVEIYNNLEKSMKLEKTRFTIGSDYKINRHNGVSLFYRYILASDSDDDESLHAIGVAYTFKIR